MQTQPTLRLLLAVTLFNTCLLVGTLLAVHTWY